MDIRVRSFAPFESFGGGFAGDNRGFSTDLNVTSRIAGLVTINPTTGDIVEARFDLAYELCRPTLFNSLRQCREDERTTWLNPSGRMDRALRVLAAN